MAELERQGIGFQSVTEAIDTTTPGGKLVFHTFAALAEFERNLIRERTHTGLEAPRRGGEKATGDRRSATSSRPWRLTFIGRKSIQLAKSARWSASPGRRSMRMSSEGSSRRSGLPQRSGV